MSDLRETLTRIRAQADAASEGPWDYQCGHDTPSGWQDAYVLGADGESVVSEASDWNAEFIAAARTTVPALLDALESVLEVHTPAPCTITDGTGVTEGTICGHCLTTEWPCPTVTTITRALEGDAP